MKILILGGIAYPPKSRYSDFLPVSEPFVMMNSHGHPWIYNLAKGLLDLGNEVHIACVLGSNTTSRSYHVNIDGIGYHFIRSSTKFRRIISFFQSDIFLVRNFIRELDPDIVHGQSRGLESLFAVKSGYPYIITNHGQIDEHFSGLKGFYKIFSIKYWFAKFIETRVNINAKMWIAVSPNCERDLLRRTSQDKIFSIDNSINEIFFTSIKPKYIDSSKILFIGSITPLKRVDLLVRLIHELDAKLEIIYHKKDEIFYNEIVQFINEKNIQDKITFTTALSQKDLVLKYQEAKIFILPSEYESFGMVLAEAMATGTPVIASNVAGPSYIIENNETGLLFEKGNYEDLKNQVKKLLSNNVLYEHISESCRTTARQRWHPINVAKQTLKAYQIVINERKHDI